MFEDQTTIIGIAGGTGSGKTTVVKKIVEALPPHYVAVVPLDSYYNDTSHMTDEERHDINFDHPDAFDWKLLHKQVNDLREGRAIEQPTYSYLQCNRLPETIHVEPKPVIIIEGIMTLLNKKLRDLMDLKIFVDCDPDERSRPHRLHGRRTLFGGTQTHARTIHRAHQALCRHHHSARRRKHARHLHSAQLHRGFGTQGMNRHDRL